MSDTIGGVHGHELPSLLFQVKSCSGCRLEHAAATGGSLAIYHTSTPLFDVSRVNSMVTLNVCVYFINVQSVIAMLLDMIKNIVPFLMLGNDHILQLLNAYHIILIAI